MEVISFPRSLQPIAAGWQDSVGAIDPVILVIDLCTRVDV